MGNEAPRLSRKLTFERWARKPVVLFVRITGKDKSRRLKVRSQSWPYQPGTEVELLMHGRWKRATVETVAYGTMYVTMEQASQ